ncbi:hypothetical protein HA402_000827 [Bradysia odoriphaga]|nr:hypothetical protein HA402_000827 [Bradysia odoriphaga]
MDNRIDVTKRKPRRLRGTPAQSFINRGSLIILGVGTIIGLALTFPLNLVDRVKEKYDFDIINVSEKEKERRSFIARNYGERKSGEEILALLKEQENLQEKANER